MTTPIRILIGVALLTAIGGVFYLKNTGGNSALEDVPLPVADATVNSASAGAGTAEVTPVAALADDTGKAKLMCFGAERCVPCRMMIPVRQALAEEYPDTLAIEFVDVWQDRSAGAKHNIRVIPTAIFFDAEGEELYRQEGYMDKETIVARFTEHGVHLAKTAAP